MMSNLRQIREGEIGREHGLPFFGYKAAWVVHDMELSSSRKEDFYNAVQVECTQVLDLIAAKIHSCKQVSDAQRIGLLKDFQLWRKEFMRWVKQSLFGKSINSVAFTDLLFSYLDLHQRLSLMFGIDTDAMAKIIEKMRTALSQEHQTNALERAMSYLGLQTATGKVEAGTPAKTSPERLPETIRLRDFLRDYSETQGVDLDSKKHYIQRIAKAGRIELPEPLNAEKRESGQAFLYSTHELLRVWPLCCKKDVNLPKLKSNQKPG